jgi:uroporphyrinogen decarboxylase
MTGKERTINVILNKKADRMPIYGWINNADFHVKIVEKYGGPEAFFDKYEFDMYHLFSPGRPVLNPSYASTFFDDGLPVVEFTNPDDMPYNDVKPFMDLHSAEKGRFVYVQTPGCFEFFNGVWGIENHLSYLLLYTEQIREIYETLADWTVVYVNNLIDFGVDMIHISDDWGAQTGMLFSNEIWDYLVYPYHKKVAEAVTKRDVFLSLHSDGNVMSVLDRICDIGFDVMHPYQESAGMSYDVYFKKYRDQFVIHGGLDVQTTIGFGDYTKLESEIKRVFNLFKDGGLLFCTTHMIQPHCSIEEAEFAYDLIYDLVRS